MSAETIVKMKGVVKSFPGVRAVDQVDFSLKRGEIHALLGENGSGKSTLMKILAGMYSADSGEILINDEQVDIKSPNEALKHGVAMVYQNFTLSPELTVLENIVLGSPIPFVMKPKQLKTEIKKIIDQYGLQIDLDTRVWQLSVGEQQRVEIIKCFYRGAKILILDEPTAVLTPPEAEELFVMIEKIVENGCTVVFISHKLNEVLRLADRITVIRKGKMICEMGVDGCTPESLTRSMIGRDVVLDNCVSTDHTCKGPEVLKVHNLSVMNDKNLTALNEISFNMCSGEILGIAAISGNGQAELAEAITGLRPVVSGNIMLSDDREVSKMTVQEIIDAGIAHISEKRLNRSLIPNFSIADNLVLKDYKKAPYCKKGFLKTDQINDYGLEMIDRFNIACPSPETSVKLLSGGNLQKVVLAREISRKPQIIIAVNPTYGLDVGAIEFVQEQLVEQRNLGTSILLISEELDEVLRLSDRVLVMAKGEIVGMFSHAECDRETIGLLMTGGEVHYEN